MSPAPAETQEVTKAAAYAALGGIGLKAIQWLVRALDHRHRTQQDEIKLVLDAQASMREELRKDNEELRERLDVAEARIRHLEEELRKVCDRLAEERDARKAAEADRDDARAELRLWKKGLRSPQAPSKAVVPPSASHDGGEDA